MVHPGFIRAPYRRRNGVNVTLHPPLGCSACMCVYVRLYMWHVAMHVAVCGERELFEEHEMRSQIETAELAWFLLCLTPQCAVHSLLLITGDYRYQCFELLLSIRMSQFIRFFRFHEHFWKGVWVNNKTGKAWGRCGTSARHTHTNIAHTHTYVQSTSGYRSVSVWQ